MRTWVISALIFLVVLAAVLMLGSNYATRLATTFAMYATLAIAWNFIGGMAGYPSFATAAFFGLGAYVGAIAQTRGIAIVPAWACAGAIAFVFAILLGLAILHLRGHYFAIGSLVVADVLREITNSWINVTGGGMGLNLPLTLGTPAEQARFFLLAMSALAVFAAIASIVISRGRLGVALSCIEQNEDAAQVIGIDTRRFKIAAFSIASLFMGIAGAIYASWVSYIDPIDVYDVSLSVKPIIMVLLGGVGTIGGPIVGAFVFLALEELIWRNSLEFHAGILGIIVVLLVLFLPGGIGQFRERGLQPLLRKRFYRRARS